MEHTEFGSADAASLGGKARAKSMSDEERAASARRAAEARWAKHGKQPLPRATHEGPLRIGNMLIDCAVLEDGTRVLSERAFSRALNVVRGGYQYRQREKLEAGGDLPIFLAIPDLIPFIDNDLRVEVEKPRIYIPLSGGKPASGIDAKLIPAVCNVWLKARDARVLSARQIVIAGNADILVRGLATVGIIALVDEATGYQEDRARNALAKILEAFVAKELRPWVHTFPSDYYRQMFRLRGKEYPPKGNRMPRYFGVLTNNVVYSRLAPGVLEELRRVTPRYDNGRLKQHLHRRLTDDVGHPKLLQHLGAVVALMKITSDRQWDQFIELLDRVYPPQVEMPLLEYAEKQRADREAKEGKVS